MKLSELTKDIKEAVGDPGSTGVITEETEYSFFAKVNVAELLVKFDQDPEVTKEYFIEAQLTADPASGKLRLRHYPNKDTASVTTLEKKNKVDLNRSIEELVTLPESFLKPLISLSNSVTSRFRFFVPVKRANNEPVRRQDGTIMQWQVDFFINTFDPEIQLTHEAFSEWVKIEVEVDVDALSADTVASHIPFETEALIDARSKDDSERGIIDTLYSKVYNLAGKGLAGPTGTYKPAEPEKEPDTTDDDDTDFSKHIEQQPDEGQQPPEGQGSQQELPENKEGQQQSEGGENKPDDNLDFQG